MNAYDMIIEEVNGFNEYLQEPTPDDPYMIEERGSRLLVAMNRLNFLIADAKRLFDWKYTKVVQENRNIVTSTVMRSYCASLCVDENYLVNLLDGMITKCRYEMDWCRTLLSKAKEEMKMTR